MSNKNEQNKKTVMIKERADGMSEVIITKAPSKTLFGKIVIVALCAAMIIGVVLGLVIVLIQAA